MADLADMSYCRECTHIFVPPKNEPATCPRCGAAVKARPLVDADLDES